MSDVNFNSSTKKAAVSGDAGSFTDLSLTSFTDFTQIATPANPTALHDRLYFKSDDKLYKKTSAGVESEVGGAGTPAGADTQIQFNDAGAFGGDADFIWNKTTNLLTITGRTTISAGTLASATSALRATGTLDTTGFEVLIDSSATSSGSAASQEQFSVFGSMGAGHTGAGLLVGVFGGNTALGTGNLLSLAGNFGGVFSAEVGAPTGVRVGALGKATGSSKNYGLIGFGLGGTIETVGVYGSANAFAGNGAGGYFIFDTDGNPGVRPNTTGALIANNNTAAFSIFKAQDNGSTIFEIKDGGDVVISKANVLGSSSTSLTADNQVVSPANTSYIRLSSDNAVATNRTFTLSAGTAGQQLLLEWTGTNAAELLADANTKLSVTWLPTEFDTLSLIYNGAAWLEVARSTNA